MKKVVLIIIIIFFGFLLTNPVLAVTKATGNLEVIFDEPVFSPTVVWYPGFSLSKNLIVKNKGDKTETVIIEARNIKDEEGLGQILDFKIEENSNVIYEKRFADWWQEKEVRLSDLNGGQAKTYKLTVTMDKDAGNKYQQKTVSFDLAVGFLGKDLVVLGGGGNGVGGLTDCFDSKPGLPTNLRVIPGPGPDQVTLLWDSPFLPYTYFLVAYSDTPDGPKWGNPNIGNVTSYTVSGLGRGTYWFWVKAVNGCMPGDFAGPVSLGAVAGTRTTGPAVGFSKEGLEIQKKGVEGKLSGGIATAAGEVAGTKEPICPFWWLVLIGQTVLIVAFYFFQGKWEKLANFRWPISLSIAVLGFLVDRYAHTHWYFPSKICPYTLWIALGLVILQNAVFRRLKFFKTSSRFNS